MEAVRKVGLSHSELENQIVEAEDDFIQNEILPAITESVASILQQVHCELDVEVNYVPGSPLTVHVSRPQNSDEAISDTTEDVLPDPEVLHKTEGYEGD